MADLASKVCAWEFASSKKNKWRDFLLSVAQNVDLSSLDTLFSTGCGAVTTGAKHEPCPLLGCLADVVDSSSRGETMLHRLFVNGSNATTSEAVERAVTLLVRRGGLSPSARDLLGRTPLHALVLSTWNSSLGLRRLVEVLLQLGADAEACDAGGVRASALLKKQINMDQKTLAALNETIERTSAVLNELASSEPEAIERAQEGHQAAVRARTRLAAVQSEQLAAMLLLAGQAGQGGAGGGGGSPQQLGSPITAYPGIFLSRAPLPYAVLLVAGDAALLPRSEVRTLLLPGCESKEKMLGALEGCCDPAQGYRAACALGPFEGPHGLATARALAAAWKRAALQASQVAGEGGGGGGRWAAWRAATPSWLLLGGASRAPSSTTPAPAAAAARAAPFLASVSLPPWPWPTRCGRTRHPSATMARGRSGSSGTGSPKRRSPLAGGRLLQCQW